MENKQTAVEWIEDNLLYPPTLSEIIKIIDKAKAMEKEQIKHAYADGVARHLHDKVILSEQYFEETYGK